MFPAVIECDKAVLLDSQWAVARQTLGRAQLGLGELIMVHGSQWRRQGRCWAVARQTLGRAQLGLGELIIVHGSQWRRQGRCFGCLSAWLWQAWRIRSFSSLYFF